MRQFVVCGHRAPTDHDFTLDDLPGAAGRLDLLCRCVSAGLFLSHGIREDARVWLVLQDAVTVRFEGSELRGLRPDERNIAGRVRQALESKGDAIGHQEIEASPGVAVSTRGLEPVLDEAARDGRPVWLHEDGDPAAGRDPPADPVFVLSDHEDFTDEEAALLSERAAERLRLGPAAIHADHAIAVAHNYCDTDGYDPAAY